MNEELAGIAESHAPGFGPQPPGSVPEGYDPAASLPVTRRTVDIGQGVIDLAAMKAELEASRSAS